MDDLKNGNLEKYTVEQLLNAGSQILGLKKLPKNKKQLINKLEEHL